MPDAPGTKGPDPRRWQLAVLGTLLGYGLASLDLEVQASIALPIVASALVTEWLLRRLSGTLRFDPLSALISALSLCLLLRTTSPGVAVAAGVLAIGSKYALRIRGAHFFNPSAFALVVLLLTVPGAWVSAGQWGHVALFAWAVAGCGGLVAHRAARADVSLAFLGAHAALLLGRAFRLGDPLSIPWHQLQSGALLLFAFHMISDPKTTPRTRAGRIVFAVLVALGAHAVRFVLYEPNGLLYALVAAAPLVPLIDHLLPARGTPRAPRAVRSPSPRLEPAFRTVTRTAP